MKSNYLSRELDERMSAFGSRMTNLQIVRGINMDCYFYPITYAHAQCYFIELRFKLRKKASYLTHYLKMNVDN